MKKIILLILVIAHWSINAQSVQLTEADDLDETGTYIGSHEGTHFFERFFKVEAYSERGNLRSTYEFPKYLKYHGRKLTGHTAVLWNGDPYYIAKSTFKKGQPLFHVMFKLTEGEEVTEEDGVIIASSGYEKKSAWVGNKDIIKHKVIDGDFYYLQLIAPSPKRDLPMHISLYRVNASFSAKEVCSVKVDKYQIVSLRKVGFDAAHIYFTYQSAHEITKMGVVDVAACEFSSHDINFIEDQSMHIYSHFIHPDNGMIYRFGGIISKKDENDKSFFIQKFSPEMDLKDERRFEITDFPSYNVSGRIEKQWSDGSSFRDVVYPNILSGMGIEHIFVADNGDMIAVYNFHVGNTWVASDGMRKARMFGREVVVASYNPETLRQNWRTIIFKDQDADGIEDILTGIQSDRMVGAVAYPFKDGVLVVYNDDVANARAGVNDPKIESWHLARKSNVVGVYVNGNGEAKKEILCAEKGQNLLIQKMQPAYPDVRLSNIKEPPFLYVQDRKDVLIGEVK